MFARELRLAGAPAHRPPIGKALAEHPGSDHLGALHIAIAQPDALVVAEIKFRAVAMQVRLGNVVICSDDAALED